MPLSAIHGSVFWNEALRNKCKSSTPFSSIKYSWEACSFWIDILFLLCLKASALLVAHFEISGIHSCNIGSCSHFHAMKSIKFPTEGKRICSVKKYIYLWGPSLQFTFLFQDDNSEYFFLSSQLFRSILFCTEVLVFYLKSLYFLTIFHAVAFWKFYGDHKIRNNKKLCFI